MNFIIISGSHRKKSQSEKIALFIQTKIKNLGVNFNTDLISLKGNPLPLWDESVWEKSPTWEKNWGPYRTKLQSADAFVFVVPEWGGMVPPAFKNFLLLSGPNEMGHKPVLLVTVSASRNGAYPISELRMSGYKNNYLCYLPEHIIVRNAETVLNSTTPENDDDNYIQKRIQYELNILNQYAMALKKVRESGILNYTDYGTGM